jgi:hypothetical protein
MIASSKREMIGFEEKPWYPWLYRSPMLKLRRVQLGSYAGFRGIATQHCSWCKIDDGNLLAHNWSSYSRDKVLDLQDGLNQSLWPIYPATCVECLGIMCWKATFATLFRYSLTEGPSFQN